MWIRSIILFAVILSAIAFCAADAEKTSNDPNAKLIADAKAGDAGAQYLLAFMYAEGQGIEKDMQAALKWYTAAAEQGHSGAQLTLGMMYAEGTAVEKDYDKAIVWYTKAAEQGNPGVQMILASMLVEKGQLVEAYAWMLLAEKNGKDASLEKSKLVEKMTPEQVAAAKQVATGNTAAVVAPRKVSGPAMYISKSDGFTVWLPSPPTRTMQQGGKRLLPVHYQSFADDGTQYNVSFQYRIGDEKQSTETERKLLEDYLIGRAIYSQGQSIRRKFSKFKGYNAAQFIHTTHAGGVESTHEGIVFIVNGDFVSLSCVYPSSLIPSPTFNEFANSFKFTLTSTDQ